MRGMFLEELGNYYKLGIDKKSTKKALEKCSQFSRACSMYSVGFIE